MKKYICPKLFESNEDIFCFLENNKILTRFTKASEFTYLDENEYSVKEIYKTNIKNGSHKLICVNYNVTKPQLNYHTEKEDFIIISKRPEKHKNLYLLISMIKYNELNIKIKEHKIKSEDFVLLKLVYNNSIFSFFTLHEDVLHCELTEMGNSKPHPYFYVTEPSNLECIPVNLIDYEIDLKNINLNMKEDYL